MLHGVFQSDPLLGHHSEPILFNLATLSELRSSDSIGVKVRLLHGVVQHGGEGVAGDSLKLAA